VKRRVGGPLEESIFGSGFKGKDMRVPYRYPPAIAAQLLKKGLIKPIKPFPIRRGWLLPANPPLVFLNEWFLGN